MLKKIILSIIFLFPLSLFAETQNSDIYKYTVFITPNKKIELEANLSKTASYFENIPFNSECSENVKHDLALGFEKPTKIIITPFSLDSGVVRTIVAIANYKSTYSNIFMLENCNLVGLNDGKPFVTVEDFQLDKETILQIGEEQTLTIIMSKNQ